MAVTAAQVKELREKLVQVSWMLNVHLLKLMEIWKQPLSSFVKRYCES